MQFRLPKEEKEEAEEEDREEPNDKPEWFRPFENRTAARMDKLAKDLKQMAKT